MGHRPTRTTVDVAAAPGGRAFRIYVACILVSFAGNLCYLAATTWLVLTMTGRSWTVPALFLLSAVPGVVFAPAAARMVERYDRKLLLVGIDAVAGVIVLLGPLADALGVLTPAQLFVQEFLISFGGSLFFTASRSFVREIVPPGGLLSANARLVGVYAVGNTVGALVGGLLVQYTSADVAMIVNAATFVFSAAAMSRIRADERRIPERATAGGPGVGAAFSALAARVLASRELRLFFVLFLAVAGLQRFLLGLLQPFVVQDLAGGAVGFGVVQAALALGAFAGGRLVPRLERAWGREVALGVLAGLIAPGVVAFSASPHVAVAAVVYFALGLLTQSQAITQTTIQEDDRAGGTDGSRLALLGMTQSLAVVLAFALSTVLDALVGTRATYLAVGLLFALVVVRPLVTLVRTRHAPDRDTPDRDTPDRDEPDRDEPEDTPSHPARVARPRKDTQA